MEKITKRTLIRSICQRWDQQYPPKSRAKRWDLLADQLSELDLNTATEKDIADIIGNYSWTKIICNECQKEVDCIIEIGEPLDYESCTARVCAECLKKAISLIDDDAW